MGHGNTTATSILPSANGQANGQEKKSLVKDMNAGDYEKRIAALERQLKGQSEAKPKPRTEPQGMNNTKSLWGLIIGSLITVLVFYVASLAASGEGNNSASRLLDAAGYRILINVGLMGISLLLSFLFLYLFQHPLYRYWHNKIDSKRNFQEDFDRCEPYQRLSYLSQQFWAAAFLFALLLLVIFGESRNFETVSSERREPKRTFESSAIIMTTLGFTIISFRLANVLPIENGCTTCTVEPS